MNYPNGPWKKHSFKKVRVVKSEMGVGREADEAKAREEPAKDRREKDDRPEKDKSPKERSLSPIINP